MTGPADRPAPTAGALLRHRLRESADSEPLRVPPRREGTAPATSAQRRLYFLDRLRPGSSAYVALAVFAVRGPIEPAALGRALRALVARHEALRTTFAEHDGELRQVLGPPPPTGPQVEDVERAEQIVVEPENEGLPVAVEGALAEELRRPMDLATGPLVRVRLLRSGPELHHLLLVVHHIVADGWTLSLAARELGPLYAAETGTTGAALAWPALQAGEFARLEARRLAGHEARVDLAWWLARLEGLVPLAMPLDFPRPAVQGTAGRRCSFTVPAAVRDDLHALSTRTGTTTFMVLLTAYQVVLARWTDQDDVVVGAPLAARPSAEAEELAGLVTNTVVLRTDLSGSPRFGDALQRVAVVVRDALDHQHVPFEELVARVAHTHDPAHHPLFQAAFNLKNVPDFLEVPLGEATMRPVPLGGDTAKFDLNLAFVAAGGTLRGDLEYSTELFAPATAERIVTSLLSVLAAVACDASPRIDALPLTAPGEQHRWLTLGDGGRRALPADPVHVLVARRAARQPDEPALVSDGVTTTYGELDRRAEALAARLRARGAAPETRVGVGLPRSVDQVVACFAVLKTGAAFVPLDPEHPVERLRRIRRDAGTRLLVTDNRRRSRFPAGGRTEVVVLDDPADPVASTAVLGHGPVDPHSLAYVVFTSGSSGAPKGVAIAHGGLSNLVDWHARAYDLQPGENTALLASPGFDASIWETWPSLAAGAALHVAPATVPQDPDALARWLADAAVGVTFVTTVVAQALMARPRPPHSRLHTLLTGGEALRTRPSPELGFRLVNHYGPTETTAIVTGAVVDPAPADGRPPPIGRPLTNVRVSVLDAALAPVPAGVPGMLHVGGPHVARGYLDDPRATAARFVPDPAGPEPGARLYATGDRVRWRADGHLEFVGRVDGQVKLRGFRIEVGEVEAALREQPGVLDAAVVVRDDVDAAERWLAAFVVAAPGERPAPDDLRRRAQEILPPAMVPARVVLLDALPTTRSAKVDYRHLAARPLAPAPRGGTTPPRSDLERLVAAVWGRVLGEPEIGVLDNFFDLGGHSFLALRLQEELARVLGGDVPVVLVFQYPTVASFAAHWEHGVTPPSADAPSGDPDSRGARRRTSRAQQQRDDARRGRRTRATGPPPDRPVPDRGSPSYREDEHGDDDLPFT